MTKKLELAQMIEGLRAELATAQYEGEGEAIRFVVEDVEMELEISAEEQAEGSIAAKFYVITSQFKANKKDAVTQKIKLKLKPEEEVADPKSGKKTNRPVKISDKVKAKK